MSLATQCAQELRDLAADPAYGNRAGDLNGLADAVADVDDDSWTGIDVIGAFPPDTAVAVTHKSAVEKALGVLAGVSVFLPVAWTWWSLRQASSAYSGVLAENADAGRTFLAMWTNGFDGRLAYLHQLVPMAMVSVVLIVLAMGLIVGHRLASQKNVANEEKRTAAAQSRLVAALTMAQRCLNERRSDDPSHIATMLRTSVREFRDAHEDLRKCTEILTSTTEKVSDELQDLLKSSTSAAKTLESAALAAKTASSDLGTSVDGLKDGVTGALDNLKSGVEQQTTDLKDTTAKSLKELNDATKVAVTDLKGGATDAVSDIGTDIAKLREAVAELSNRSTSTDTEMQTAISRLTDVITQLDRALSRHESALQGQATEITSARDAAERMLRHLEQDLAASSNDNRMGVQT